MQSKGGEMKKRWRWPGMAAFLAVAALTQPSGAAEPVEGFYKGKQVRIYIGNTASGDYDSYARTIGRHMSPYLPGNPTFVPTNMPGAGGIVLANHLYNVAAHDGLVIGTFSINIPNSALFKRPNVQFDPRRFGWIGGGELPSQVCVAMTSDRIKGVDDIFQKELLMGGAGAGSAPTFFPAVLNKLVGTRFKVVDGYPGSTEILLAMERHEVDGICQTYNAFRRVRGDWLDSGKAKVLFNIENAPFQADKTVPSIFSFIHNNEDKEVLDVITSSVLFGRPYVTPPGVPDERLAALRKAFEATLKDKDFLDDARKQGLNVQYRPGAELQDLTDRLFKIPQAIVDKAAQLMPEGGAN
jgi:tripartite-type tricarboxylate transporter receptor subunit TctC